MTDKLDQEMIDAVREEIAAKSTTALTFSDAELAAFLKVQQKIPAAAAAAMYSAEWKRDNPVSIADVAPFYRSAPGNKSPSGCSILLEDMKGGVARDHKGRPIALSIGMLYGSDIEQQKQVAYVMERAKEYCSPDAPLEVCYICEVASRDSGKMNTSFRMPDLGFRNTLDFSKLCYPQMQFSTTHFCGMPFYIVKFFQIGRNFIGKDLNERITLSSNFDNLIREDIITLENCLPHWYSGGKLQFDIDAYVEWRAKEEGVSAIPGCGEGRSYEIASTDRPYTTYELLGTTEGRDTVIKHGSAEKQGSGVGMFSSTKWKKKKLVLIKDYLIYFSSWKISKDVTPDRIISLDSSCSVERIPSMDSKETILLRTKTREFIFGFYTDVEAESWIEALAKECSLSL